jgi:hypothetical protein
MAILNNSNAISSGGYDINNSLRFRSSASAFLNRTPGTTGNQKTFTWSGWVKRGALGSQQFIHHAFYGDSGRYASIYFTSSDTLQVQSGVYTTGASTSTSYNYITTQVFRDPSAWYHIVLAVDTTQATSGNRVKVYVNGSQITAFGTSTAPTQNDNTFFNITTTPMFIGKYAEAPGSSFLDGYLAEVNWIDGSQLTPSSFGETDTTTGSWKPKAYTGTYGTNGFYLKFSDIATTSGSNAGLGKDFSGNTNYWTTNNISVTAGTTYDAMIDSPTLTSATVANYAVLNPLENSGENASTLSNGNLTITYGTKPQKPSTIAFTGGLWYMEVTLGAGSPNGGAIGINYSSTSGSLTSSGSYSWVYDGTTFVAGVRSGVVLSTWSSGATLMLAVDATNGKVYFGQNNSWLGSANPSAGTGANLTFTPGSEFIISVASPGNVATASANFGQRPFAYTPPTGFVRLNTYNLPDSTIKKGNTVMDATLYTGNGGTQTVTNASPFKPDFVWIKSRSAAENNVVFDSVRGVTNYLLPNSTVNEQNYGTFGVTAFNSNGFTVIGGSGYAVNTSAATYVGWQWQAGAGSSASNTSGSITSTVSVNATAGFSVVTYTGTGANATVGHGLGVAPKMIIVKNRTTSGDEWCVWHTSLTNATYYLYLNSTAAQAVDTTFWNSTAPSSTVISLGSNGRTNRSSSNMVCYAWAAIPGYSAFGSYTGNGSTDGPFVYLGFRPKFVMVKRTQDGEWGLHDTTRDSYNVVSKVILGESSGAEVSGLTLYDFTSNGFKLRDSNANRNASGGTYIYMAFAENPFKNALAR